MDGNNDAGFHRFLPAPGGHKTPAAHGFQRGAVQGVHPAGAVQADRRGRAAGGHVHAEQHCAFLPPPPRHGRVGGGRILQIGGIKAGGGEHRLRPGGCLCLGGGSRSGAGQAWIRGERVWIQAEQPFSSLPVWRAAAVKARAQGEPVPEAPKLAARLAAGQARAAQSWPPASPLAAGAGWQGMKGP